MRRMLLLAVGALLLALLPAGVAGAAVSTSRAELITGSLRVEGRGAVPSSTVRVDGGAGIASARASSDGRFRVSASGFSSPTCVARVFDGTTSVSVNLTGCTPTPPPPPPAPLAVSQVTFYYHGPLYPALDRTYSGNGVIDLLVRGRVDLNGPAPAGGVVVTFSTDSPAIVLSPASAVIGQGETAAVFAIISNEVLSPVVATVTGSLPGSSASAQISVLPTAMKRVDVGTGIGVQNLFGGNSIVTSAVFHGVAPSGGALVSLSSSSPLLSFPATLSAPAGSQQVAFTLGTSPVTVETAVSLTATYNGTSATTTFNLHPAPTLLTPNDGATVASGASILFDWAGLNGSFQYRIQIDDSPAFSDPPLVDLDQGTASSYTTSVLSSGTRYWRVQARDQYGNPGPWSGSRSVIISASSSPLGTPSLMFPANGTSVTAGSTVAFMWSAVTGAASYELQVDNSSTFAAPFVLQQNVVGSNQYQTTTLPVGSFWWRVRALSSSGTPGAWSSVRTVAVR
ncbi:MAG: hypothetical protein ACKV2O_17140 [Acidimicrobiales bacterium]